MMNRWLMALALVAAGAAGGLASSFFVGREAAAQSEPGRFQVSAWAYADAGSPRHGAFVIDRESGDTWVIVGRYSEEAEAARLCKTDYPQGVRYVGKTKK